MKIKARSVVAMSLCLGLVQAAGLRPSPIEEAGAVERTRSIAAAYVKEMPDFICTQTIRRFIRYTMPRTWQPLDLLTVKLRYANQTEDRQLMARNGAEAMAQEIELGGVSNVGEFGGMLEALFDVKTQAAFHWESVGAMRDRAVSVYAYRVERAHSQYELNFNPGYQHHVVVAYRGAVTIDRATGSVLQMVYEAEGIPADFPMQYAKTVIDYGFVEIGGKRYLLPQRSQVETGSDLLAARNVAEFTAYKKFSADTAITFGDAVEKEF